MVSIAPVASHNRLFHPAASAGDKTNGVTTSSQLLLDYDDDTDMMLKQRPNQGQHQQQKKSSLSTTLFYPRRFVIDDDIKQHQKQKHSLPQLFIATQQNKQTAADQPIQHYKHRPNSCKLIKNNNICLSSSSYEELGKLQATTKQFVYCFDQVETNPFSRQRRCESLNLLKDPERVQRDIRFFIPRNSSGLPASSPKTQKSPDFGVKTHKDNFIEVSRKASEKSANEKRQNFAMTKMNHQQQKMIQQFGQHQKIEDPSTRMTKPTKASHLNDKNSHFHVDKKGCPWLTEDHHDSHYLSNAHPEQNQYTPPKSNDYQQQKQRFEMENVAHLERNELNLNFDYEIIARTGTIDDSFSRTDDINHEVLQNPLFVEHHINHQMNIIPMIPSGEYNTTTKTVKSAKKGSTTQNQSFNVHYKSNSKALHNSVTKQVKHDQSIETKGNHTMGQIQSKAAGDDSVKWCDRFLYNDNNFGREICNDEIDEINDIHTEANNNHMLSKSSRTNSITKIIPSFSSSPKSTVKKEEINTNSKTQRRKSIQKPIQQQEKSKQQIPTQTTIGALISCAPGFAVPPVFSRQCSIFDAKLDDTLKRAMETARKRSMQAQQYREHFQMPVWSSQTNLNSRKKLEEDLEAEKKKRTMNSCNEYEEASSDSGMSSLMEPICSAGANTDLVTSINSVAIKSSQSKQQQNKSYFEKKNEIGSDDSSLSSTDKRFNKISAATKSQAKGQIKNKKASASKKPSIFVQAPSTSLDHGDSSCGSTLNAQKENSFINNTHKYVKSITSSQQHSQQKQCKKSSAGEVHFDESSVPTLSTLNVPSNRRERKASLEAQLWKKRSTSLQTLIFGPKTSGGENQRQPPLTPVLIMGLKRQKRNSDGAETVDIESNYVNEQQQHSLSNSWSSLELDACQQIFGLSKDFDPSSKSSSSYSNGHFTGQRQKKASMGLINKLPRKVSESLLKKVPSFARSRPRQLSLFKGGTALPRAINGEEKLNNEAKERCHSIATPTQEHQKEVANVPEINPKKKLQSGTHFSRSMGHLNDDDGNHTKKGWANAWRKLTGSPHHLQNGCKNKGEKAIVGTHGIVNGKGSALDQDWEVAAVRELARRLSLDNFEPAELPLPEGSQDSQILDEFMVRQIVDILPPRAAGYPWVKVYSSEKHGFSLSTLYRRMGEWNEEMSPVLLLIRDTVGHVFGAIVSTVIQPSEHYYGTGDSSLLFRFTGEYPQTKELQVYNWTGENQFFINATKDFVSFGAGGGHYGLWLDAELNHGRSQKCSTFNNELLAGGDTDDEDFVVQFIEAFGFSMSSSRQDTLKSQL